MLCYASNALAQIASAFLVCAWCVWGRNSGPMRCEFLVYTTSHLPCIAWGEFRIDFHLNSESEHNCVRASARAPRPLWSRHFRASDRTINPSSYRRTRASVVLKNVSVAHASGVCVCACNMRYVSFYRWWWRACDRPAIGDREGDWVNTSHCNSEIQKIKNLTI